MATSTSKAQQQREDKAEALVILREELADVRTIYTVLLSVSREGTSRRIMPLVAKLDREGRPVIHDLTWMVAQAGIFRRPAKGDGLIVGGGGMDMGFHLVDVIVRSVFGDDPWPCWGDGYGDSRCPSNDHVNPPRKDYGDGVTHTDGYRIQRKWL